MAYASLYSMLQDSEERVIVRDSLNSLTLTQLVLIYAWSSELEKEAKEEIERKCGTNFEKWSQIHCFTDLSDSVDRMKKLINFFMENWNMSSALHNFDQNCERDCSVEEAIEKAKNTCVHDMLKKIYQLHLIAKSRVMQYVQSLEDILDVANSVDCEWLFNKVAPFVSIENFDEILDKCDFPKEYVEKIIDMVLPSAESFDNWNSIRINTSRIELQEMALAKMNEKALGFYEWNILYKINPSEDVKKKLSQQLVRSCDDVELLIQEKLISEPESILLYRLESIEKFDDLMHLSYSIPEEQEEWRLKILQKAVQKASCERNCLCLLEEESIISNDILRLRVKKMLVEFVLEGEKNLFEE